MKFINLNNSLLNKNQLSYTIILNFPYEIHSKIHINSSKSKHISIHIYMHIISMLIKLYLIISRYLIEEQCLVYV
jgi:hypothetical protein